MSVVKRIPFGNSSIIIYVCSVCHYRFYERLKKTTSAHASDVICPLCGNNID